MTAKVAKHFPQVTVVLRLHTYRYIFTITLWGWLYPNPYFIKRETEDQGGKSLDHRASKEKSRIQIQSLSFDHCTLIYELKLGR